MGMGEGCKRGRARGSPLPCSVTNGQTAPHTLLRPYLSTRRRRTIRGAAQLRFRTGIRILEDLLWGIVNGVTAWPLLVIHLFDIWEKYPVYNIKRDSGWYQFGFLIGTGSPLLGLASGRARTLRGGILGRRR